MSLLSQQDREKVIRALEFFIENDAPHRDEIYQYNTLLNWVKLEYEKNK